MKKACKITCISIASIIGLIIIAIIVALSIVLTPSRLTTIVKKQAPNFIECQVDIERAELTLLKTFPKAGICINNITLINPIDECHSDTLLSVQQAVAAVDIWKLTTKKQIIVKSCSLNGVNANIFTNSQGQNNYDIFGSSDNTEEEDNSSDIEMYIDIDEIQLNNMKLSYHDITTQTLASLYNTDMTLHGTLHGSKLIGKASVNASKATLDMPKQNIDLNDLKLSLDGSMDDFSSLKGTLTINTPDITADLMHKYLNHDTIDILLIFEGDLDDKHVHLDDASISLNDYVIELQGDASLEGQDNISTDISFSTNDIVVDEIIARLPEDTKQSLLGEMKLSGLIRGRGTMHGVYNDSLIPNVEVFINANQATLSMPELPHPLNDITLDATLNLNPQETSDAHINALAFSMNNTSLQANGTVNDILGNMITDIDINGCLDFNDVKAFLPDDMMLKGTAEAQLKIKGSIKKFTQALEKNHIEHLVATAHLDIHNMTLRYDTILAMAPDLNLKLNIPSNKTPLNATSKLSAQLKSQSLLLSMGSKILSSVHDADLAIATSNILDTNKIPTATIDFAFNDLTMNYDTIHVMMQKPTGSVSMMPSSYHANNIKAEAQINSSTFEVQIGSETQAQINSIILALAAEQNQSGKNLLQQWTPTATIQMHEATLESSDYPIVEIPSIDFTFTPEFIEIMDCSLQLGESDFSLAGEITGLQSWLSDDGLLTGQLDLTSRYTNINEIIDITSGLGTTSEFQEEFESDTPTQRNDNPFVVPMGADLKFNLSIATALFENTNIYDTKGQLTVKDGILVLEQVGFTSNAAEMQLTAMYKSPRKNHLFVGLDFHLLDIHFEELITMIPVIDTLVPMLKTFDGKGAFHIVAQTNLKSNYEPKLSTLFGAAAIEGHNLRVTDTASFSKITNFLQISDNGTFMIDSLDVQFTVTRNEIEVYPFLIAMGKYNVVASGMNNLDMNFDYHISVTKTPLPIRLGLDIKGNINDLKYSLAPCRYKNLYRPAKRNEVDQQVLDLKKLITNSLKQTVKPKRQP